MTDSEQDQKNRELMEALRKIFEPLARRLTPEIEPAVVYVIDDDSRDR